MDYPNKYIESFIEHPAAQSFLVLAVISAVAFLIYIVSRVDNDKKISKLTKSLAVMCAVGVVIGVVWVNWPAPPHPSAAVATPLPANEPTLQNSTSDKLYNSKILTKKKSTTVENVNNNIHVIKPFSNSSSHRFTTFEKPLPLTPQPPSIYAEENRPTATIITNPDWEVKPTQDEAERLFPERAQRMGVNGRANLHCRISVLHLAYCTVTDESPSGFGFGEAAIKLSRYFRLRPLTRNGLAVEGGVADLPVDFVQAPDVAPQPTTIRPSP